MIAKLHDWQRRAACEVWPLASQSWAALLVGREKRPERDYHWHQHLFCRASVSPSHRDKVAGAVREAFRYLLTCKNRVHDTTRGGVILTMTIDTETPQQLVRFYGDV